MIDTIADGLTDGIPRPKILIVDDIEANLIAMRRLLRHVDAELLTAQSGNDALSLALDHQFALALLDVQMPEMDGYEVATHLRDNPGTEHTPIVFMTASNSDEISELRGYRSGAIDYIGKPVNEQILLSKVEMFLQLYRNKQQLVSALTEVHRQRQILQATFDSVCDGIIATANDGRVSWMNPAAERMTGWPAANSHPLESVLPLLTVTGEPGNHALFARGSAAENRPLMMLRTRGGALLPVTSSGSVVRDPSGTIVGSVIVFQNASDAYSRQLALIGRAETDPLTGLLNRAGFDRRLRAMMSKEQEQRGDLALLFGDLDGFKHINDTFGHAAGDVVLKEVGTRMLRSVREDDVVARWAGDEFAVLMPCEDRRAAEHMAERLVDAICQPLEIKEGVSVTVGITIGIAMASSSNWDERELLEEADHLLYAGKTRKRRAATPSDCSRRALT